MRRITAQILVLVLAVLGLIAGVTFVSAGVQADMPARPADHGSLDVGADQIVVLPPVDAGEEDDIPCWWYETYSNETWNERYLMPVGWGGSEPLPAVEKPAGIALVCGPNWERPGPGRGRIQLPNDAPDDAARVCSYRRTTCYDLQYLR